MTRKETIEKIVEIISEMTDVEKAAMEIFDTIEPPEIKLGMWGKAWFDHTGRRGCVYGKLYAIEDGRYLLWSGGGTRWKFFTPMTPQQIKEAIEEDQKL